MTIKIRVPELGESVLEATVMHWLKQEGEPVAVGEVLVELETDKVNLEVGAERAGVLARIEVPEGADVQVGDVLGEIDERVTEPERKPATAPAKPEQAEQPAAAEKPPATARQADAPPVEAGGGDGRTRESQAAPLATPVAERLAQERGVDLAQVSGSGPGGRVTKGDVERYLQPSRQPAEQEPPAATGKISPPAPAPDERPVERQRMSRRRRTIARRLVEAQQAAAMLTTFNEVDMGALMDLRRRRKGQFQERHGVKLGLTSFFVKASISALRAFPRLNAEIEGDELVLKKYYDIGIAIGAEEGLVVPVLRAADRLSIAAIEQQIADYVEKVQTGSLSIEDLRGGTFSLTNGGVFGSLLSTPILNPPQVGILGMHKIEDRPVAVDGEVVIRPMMYVALTYDHRIVDGREAVQFLVQIKELIEDPERLFLEA